MRNRLFILLLTNSLISCNSQDGKSSKVITAKDSSFLTVERFFPETKEIEKVDTVIADRQLQITITRANLDSYVKNEYEDEGKKIIDKYRDYEVIARDHYMTATARVWLYFLFQPAMLPF